MMGGGRKSGGVDSRIDLESDEQRGKTMVTLDLEGWEEGKVRVLGSFQSGENQ